MKRSIEALLEQVKRQAFSYRGYKVWIMGRSFDNKFLGTCDCQDSDTKIQIILFQIEFSTGKNLASDTLIGEMSQ